MIDLKRCRESSIFVATGCNGEIDREEYENAKSWQNIQDIPSCVLIVLFDQEADGLTKKIAEIADIYFITRRYESQQSEANHRFANLSETLMLLRQIISCIKKKKKQKKKKISYMSHTNNVEIIISMALKKNVRDGCNSSGFGSDGTYYYPILPSLIHG